MNLKKKKLEKRKKIGLVNLKIKKKTNKKKIIQINNVLHSYQTQPGESTPDPGDLRP
jgi:hypothetical protein